MRRARRGASCLIISRLSNKTGARWAYEADVYLGESDPWGRMHSQRLSCGREGDLDFFESDGRCTERAHRSYVYSISRFGA